LFLHDKANFEVKQYLQDVLQRYNVYYYRYVYQQKVRLSYVEGREIIKYYAFSFLILILHY